MIKRILGIVIVALMAGYLVFSLSSLTDNPRGTVCEGLDFKIQDSLHYGLLTPGMITGLLDEWRMNPVGKELDQIDLDSMEHIIMNHPMVLSAECFKTAGKTVKIKIHTCVPLVRVLGDYGTDYLVDSRGRILERNRSVVQVPVATGHISREFASTGLVKLVETVNESRFWKAQVEQINIDANGQIELVPRVGNHLIKLGNADNLEEKLDRLMMFYQDGLNKIGWNKYSSISVAYDGQVVCRRR